MWPDSFVHLFPAVLPPGVLAGVGNDADALAATDNFFIPKERILAGLAACRTHAELAVCLLYQQHVAQHLPADASWAGAEYWVQVYEPGLGLGFHFDKDEHLLKSSGDMLHPIWSSILYLTGSAGPGSSGGGGSSSSSNSAGCSRLQDDGDWDGARLAPTVILQQLFDSEQGCPYPDIPAASVLVWPCAGSYCLFDGRLGHGVLNSCSSSRRATLLINWWHQQPMSVHELQDDMIPQLHLAPLSPGVTTDLVSSCSTGSAQQKHQSGSNAGLQHPPPPPQPQQQEQALKQPGAPAVQQQQQSEPCHEASAAAAASLAAAVQAASLEDASSSSSSSSSSKTREQGVAVAAAAATGTAADASNAATAAATAAAAAGGDVEEAGNTKPSLLQPGGVAISASSVPAAAGTALPSATCSYGGSSSSSTKSSSGSSRAKLPVCTVALKEGEDAEGPSTAQLLDGVLAANQLSLVGPAAVHAVAFHHPGFVLYPVEPADAESAAEQLQSSGQDQQGASKKLQTLAAFLAQHVLQSEESDDD